ncbi:hypothetical protein [Streptomyces sp. TLI_146]|uniref:hypothetical protein n=1 Tax=Streptomyces sp. TLI_146 TaxID=1938858 RepID=UPI0027D80534|nr:hypothetical protein [Streptomyces sp. TLI_146]
MHGPDSWLRRASKGLLCASVCLLLGAVGHVAAGGRLPGPGGLGLVFAALTVVGTVLFGGRRRRFDVTTLALGATQFGLHLAFHHLSMPDGSPSPAMTAMPAMPGSASQQHAMPGHAPGAHVGMDMAGMAHAGSGHVMTAGMTLAHAVATLGTALCVIYGERMLRRLAALVLPRLRFATPPSLPVPPKRQLPPPPATGHVRLGVLFTRCRPRRGPPPVIPA